MEKEKEKKLEREYVIPLRRKVRHSPRYKKANKAVRTVKEFLAKHMKVENRDLNKIKLDLSVNEAIWARGIKNPIHKIKVKATKEGDIVRVTLVDVPKKILARRNRVEKREKVEEKKVIKKEKVEEKTEDKKETEKKDTKDTKVEKEVEDKKEEEKVEKKEEKKKVEEKEAKPKEDKVKTEKKSEPEAKKKVAK